MVDTLIRYGQEAEKDGNLNHKCVYFWFDLFMNDQNKAESKPQRWWSTTFREAIGNIGHTLVVLSPWNDPIPLTRAWCLFEILQTIENKGCKFEVVMPAKEKMKIRDAVLQDYRSVQTVLCTVDAEKADAFRSQDRDMIFAAVRAMDGGFHALNTRIKALMRGWILRMITKLVAEGSKAYERRLDHAKLCTQVAGVLKKSGDFLNALQMHKIALKIRSDELGEGHAETGESWSSVGVVSKNLGRLDEALECTEKAARILERALGLTHPKTAECLNDTALVLRRIGRHSEALALCRRGLEARQSELGEEHPDTLESLSNVGVILHTLGDHDGALKIHMQAFKARARVLGGKQ